MKLWKRNTLTLILATLLTLSMLSLPGHASEDWKLYPAGTTLTEDIIGAPPDVAVLVAEEEEIQRTEKELAQEELAEMRPIIASMEKQLSDLMAGLNAEREARESEIKTMRAEIRQARKSGFWTGLLIPIVGFGIYSIAK